MQGENNVFHYMKNTDKAWKKIELPTGSYDLVDIQNYLKKQDPELLINISVQESELTSEIYCENAKITFLSQDSFHELLGFEPSMLKPGIVHKSEKPMNILNVNTIRVECNITTGAYMNNQLAHTIHAFFPSVPPGYKIIEIPKTVIYLPVIAREIHNLQLRLVDQNGNLINNRGETITIRLHIKSV